MCAVSKQELNLIEKENSGDANRKKSNCMKCHILQKLLLLFLLFLCCTALSEVALSANRARMKDRLISKIKAAEESLMQWVVILP